MTSNNGRIEKRLWDAADELRANSRLPATDPSQPVLGLIFLLSLRYQRRRAQLEAPVHHRPDLLEPDRPHLVPC